MQGMRLFLSTLSVGLVSLHVGQGFISTLSSANCRSQWAPLAGRHLLKHSNHNHRYVFLTLPP
jgi:hypothetical protein